MNGKAVAVVDEQSVGNLLQQAIDKGISVEGLEKLVALHERMADRLAAQEFADALAAFQQECPPIPKNKTAEIVTHKGARYRYEYATLDAIANTVRPLLHQHGLSYSWDSATQNGVMDVTCTIRHRNGHRESARFTLTVDNPSAMNDQQKHGAALTYGRRQSLVAALGLTIGDPDTDGVEPGACVTPEQVARLEEAFEGVRMSKDKLYRVLGIEAEALADIPQALYPTAMNLLRLKRQEQDRKGGI